MTVAWLIVATIAIVAALALSTVALLRALLPPQTRDVRELRGNVEELADELDATNARITRRAKEENTSKARAARSQQVDLVEQARELVKTSPAASPSAAFDREAQRAAILRSLSPPARN